MVDKCTWTFRFKSCPNVCSAVNIPTVKPLEFANDKIVLAANFVMIFNKSLLSQNKTQSLSGIVKVICCHSVFGNILCCLLIHISVCFFPQEEQAFDLHVKGTITVWSQSLFEHLYFAYPRNLVPQLSNLVIARTISFLIIFLLDWKNIHQFPFSKRICLTVYEGCLKSLWLICSFFNN